MVGVGVNCSRKTEIGNLLPISIPNTLISPSEAGIHIPRCPSQADIARSDYSKSNLIHDDIVDRGIDMACITKSCLKWEGRISLNEIFSPGYR